MLIVSFSFSIRLGVNVSDFRISYNGISFDAVKVNSIEGNSLASKFLKSGDFLICGDINTICHATMVDEPSNDIQTIGDDKGNYTPSRKISKTHISFDDIPRMFLGFSLNKLSTMLSNMGEYTPFIMYVIRDGRFLFYSISYE